MIWYKVGQVVGAVFVLTIYAYLTIDLYNNIRNGNSVTSNIAALFAVASWQNLIRLATACQANKEIIPVETTQKKFYRLERD